MSEREVTCTCGKKTARDDIRLAHIITIEKEFVLAEIYMVNCEYCGVNWIPFSTFGGDWIEQKIPLRDLCGSDAEIAFYNQRLLPFEKLQKYYPQVFLPINGNYGYFADFMPADKSAIYEVDGLQHAIQVEHDIKRDKMIFSKYGIKTIRYQFNILDCGEYEFTEYQNTE